MTLRKEIIDNLGSVDDSEHKPSELRHLIGEVFEVYEEDDRTPDHCLAALQAVADAFLDGETFSMELSSEGLDPAESVEVFVALARRAAMKAVAR